jgi:penicillin amidase
VPRRHGPSRRSLGSPHPPHRRGPAPWGGTSFDLWHSDAGQIEGDPRVPGRYLARAWVGDVATLAAALDVPRALEAASSLDEALDAAASMPLPFNYIVACTDGGIGLQQSGLAPCRAPGASGLFPLEGSDPANHWRGMLPDALRVRHANPAAGFIATANEPVQEPGGPVIVNAALSCDRQSRITELLQGMERAAPGQMAAIHSDLTSHRARRWLDQVGDLLPGSRNGWALRRWDGVFRADSREPTRFLRWVAEAMTEAYGELFARADETPANREQAPPDGLSLPREAARYWLESNLVVAQYPGFEAVLLDPDSALWTGRDRDRLLSEAAERALAGRAAPHRRAQRVRRSWFLLEGTLIGRRAHLPGSLATIWQGRIIRTGGRVAALQPVWRMTADLSEEVIHTALNGGPSDRPMSRFYRLGQRDFAAARTRTLEVPGTKGGVDGD